MLNHLHNNIPSSILLNWGPIEIRWYGLIISLSIISALLLSFWLGKKYYQIKRDVIFDLAFWLIIGGIVGARIYDVFLQLPYYLQKPLEILKIWQGGLAIHGAVIVGLIIIYYFGKKHKISFLKISSLVVPGLALGQTIGRFGNYFNQELFGLPTNLPWGIPIEPWYRPLEYLNQTHFHPTFLYESLGCLIIAIILISRHVYANKRQLINENFFAWSLAIYMILYSLIRFLLEFIRLDPTPLFIGLRWPQIISLFFILGAILLIINTKKDVLEQKKEK